jgi:dihydroxyacetone kinase
VSTAIDNECREGVDVTQERVPDAQVASVPVDQHGNVMKRLSNDPRDFSRESIKGFLLAHHDDVVAADGGVLRVQESVAPTVAVVTGGGSGHYPAFAGYVGPGMATGAVLGNIFASPSARQVESVGRAADRGRGVLFVYGNYAGDVLNFDEGQNRLRLDGHDVMSLAVTDDISSAPSDQRSRRRGVAGDLVVLKTAGAAAWEGRDLGEVADVAQRTNSATRTLGVAFSGCTLPGAEAPLFEVAEGFMGVGMGIHGEPGVAEVPRTESRPLAHLLVESLLAERPAGAEDLPVVAILNGLGTTKSEELFVLWADIADFLQEKGVQVATVDVGELVTSFDMSGLSLTLSWLDADLLQLWRAPAHSAAYRRSTPPTGSKRLRGSSPGSGPSVPRNSPATVDPLSETVAEIAAAVDARIAAIEDELGRLDAVAGDGDHGIGMRRGTLAATRAARQAAERGSGLAATVRAAGEAWGDDAGGTSGALWSAALIELARKLPDDRPPSAAELADGVSAAVDVVCARGGAQIGDKTFVDALVPFAATFREKLHEGPLPALRTATTVAVEAARATANLTPSLGRSRTHPTRSMGHADPGAISFAEVVSAITDWLEERN